MQTMMESLNQYSDKFTETDVRIYNYIRNNTNKIVNFTIKEFAEATETSTAAITRFVQKTGYSKYIDFRLDVGQYLATTTRINPEELFETDDQEKLERLGLFAKNSIDLALQEDNEETLDFMIKSMMDTDLIIVHGTGLSLLAAESFYQKALRAGLRVHILRDLVTTKDMIRTHRGSGFLLSISNSGVSREVAGFVEFAKSFDFQAVAMTRTGNNDVANLADYQLSLGETMSSVSAVNSYIYAELVMIDLIFIKLAAEYDLTEQITTWDYKQFK